MIKQSALIRDRVMFLTIELMRRLHAYTSMLPEFEPDVLPILEHPKQFDTAAEIAQMIMARLNGETTPINRFDKTRRAMAKKIPKGPRGVPRKKRIVQAPTPEAVCQPQP
jgi:hypothetical protein